MALVCRIFPRRDSGLESREVCAMTTIFYLCFIGGMLAIAWLVAEQNKK